MTFRKMLRQRSFWEGAERGMAQGVIGTLVVVISLCLAFASLSGCESAAEAQQFKAAAIVKVASAEVEAVQQQSELPDDLERPEAVPEPTPAKASELHKARVDQLTEQVDAYGLAAAEVESSLNEKFKKMSERLTEMEQRLGQIEQEQAKTWLLLHTPPMVKGEVDPVKEFMEAKRPEVYWFSPDPETWFRCIACERFDKATEGKKFDFDLVHGFIKDDEERKGMGVPDAATFPVFKISDKAGKWWWIYVAPKSPGPTPEWVAQQFKAHNR